DTKLRFIFSHSALREGWDNPNVFQICTLNETKSEVKKRQEIGRGLRLCVNQNGERQYNSFINTLTIMANERYEEFAAALQKEYETENGIKFGVIEPHLFANIPVKQEDGSLKCLGQEASEAIFKAFLDNEYINTTGKIQDKLKIAIKDNKLNVPVEYEFVKPEIITIVSKVCSGLNIKNNSDKKTVKLNKRVYLDPEFKNLWDRIKYKTTYSVEFDSEKLIDECCKEMKEILMVSAAKLIYTKAGLNISVGGIIAEESDRYTVGLDNFQENLPDIIAYLQNETNLTRKTIVKILTRSNTIHLFKKNPQKYMEQVAQIITAKMRNMIIDGIKYTKIGDDEYYAQELFEAEELTGYLHKNMIESKKSLYEYVIYDSANEESFAKRFEANKRVKLYVKLPSWFTIPTPLGSYNPDWAILIDADGKDKLYFVLETKADIMFDALRPTESAKIKCGKKHFEALDREVSFEVIDNFEEFLEETVVKN
ncbi:MAG: type III restriction endonuclease subunit R, partial [Mollicutes bacterium]|nr:type III restriction endonuclease subunit R [Mollicutes bacterium]